LEVEGGRPRQLLLGRRPRLCRRPRQVCTNVRRFVLSVATLITLALLAVIPLRRRVCADLPLTLLNQNPTSRIYQNRLPGGRAGACPRPPRQRGALPALPRGDG
ncbi:unnamed protein product, partial [Phaeothamnion confervicola]